MAETQVEPWLRGTHTDVAPVQRAVLHALELAREDGVRWAGGLSNAEVEAQPHDLPSVGFQMRHISRSLDRLLTYAEGNRLSEAQLRELRTEKDPGVSTQQSMLDYTETIELAIARILRFKSEQLADVRGVGREYLPTTITGLLVHVADHTQRHVGQLITTAKVVMALR